MREISIRRPDDWHVHLRDGPALAAVAKFTAERFGRAIVMPNLKPPIVSVDQAAAYRERIVGALPAGSRFEPLMTLYLTDATVPAEIDRAKSSSIVHGVKLYPAGATTHSEAGVTDIGKTYAVLERMQRLGMPLLVHGEATRPDVDVFDRETVFIDELLAPLVERFPQLKIVFEHITTERAAQFVAAARPGVAATITPQHLLLNRNAIFAGGLRPHFYCLPVLKRERDREALVRAATGGSPKYFLGTDSAPHERSTKENACGCAGMFTAHAAIELYAEVFDEAGRAGPAGRVREPLRRRFLRASPPRGAHHADQGSLEAGGDLRLRRRRRGAAIRAGEDIAWRLAPGSGRLMQLPPITFATRFRGFLPVVIDVETGGFNSQTDALLEIAAVLIEMRSDGSIARGETHRLSRQALSRARTWSPPRWRSPASTRFIRCARRSPRRMRCNGSSARCAPRCAPPIARGPCWSATTPPST